MTDASQELIRSMYSFGAYVTFAIAGALAICVLVLCVRAVLDDW